MFVRLLIVLIRQHMWSRYGVCFSPESTYSGEPRGLMLLVWLHPHNIHGCLMFDCDDLTACPNVENGGLGTSELVQTWVGTAKCYAVIENAHREMLKSIIPHTRSD